MPVHFFPARMAMHSRMFLFGWTAALLSSGGASWTWGRSEAKGLCDTHGASAWPADDVTLARLTIVFAFDIFFYESRLAVALVFLCFN